MLPRTQHFRPDSGADPAAADRADADPAGRPEPNGADGPGAADPDDRDHAADPAHADHAGDPLLCRVAAAHRALQPSHRVRRTEQPVHRGAADRDIDFRPAGGPGAAERAGAGRRRGEQPDKDYG